MRVFCFTSDRHLWALKAFAWLHQRYWGCPVDVAGFTPPEWELPENFSFHSIGRFEDYPVHRWSDAVIKFLESVEDELFVWTMEDFWVLRQVDTEAIVLLEAYMRAHPEIARIDLSRDRANNANIRNTGYLGRLDLVESMPDVPYHFSFQVGIWRREWLLKCLNPGETPNEAEVNGSHRLIESGARVLGTRQHPIKYLIAVQFGKVQLEGGYQGSEYALMGSDRDQLSALGYLDGTYLRA